MFQRVNDHAPDGAAVVDVLADVMQRRWIDEPAINQPRMPDQPDDRRGPQVFGYLEDGQALPPVRRDEVAEALVAAWPK